MITPIVQFFSDPLRLTLLVVGFIVLVVVYFISRRPRLSKSALAEENKAVHPSQYQDLPEERGGVGKVSVRKASDEEKVMPKAKSPLKTFRKDEERMMPPTMFLDDEDDGVGPVTVKPAAPKSASPSEPAKPSAKVAASAPKTEFVDDESHYEVPPMAEPVVRVTERVKLSRDKAKKTITLFLRAEDGRHFGGRLFISAMHEVGLELGEGGMYHHFAKEQNRSYVNFSVANISEPGSFELRNVDDFATNGLRFFMQVPMEVGSASLAFTQMMSAAQRLARRLGGKLVTEQYKPLTVSEINVMRIDVEKYM